MENYQIDFNEWNDDSSKTNADDARISAVTPENDNGVSGPGNYTSQVGGEDDDDDEELIPIEGDDDDLDAIDDDDLDIDDDDLDDDLETDEDDDDLDPLADRPTTFSSDANFSDRSHGRSTGTMIDHEPGIPGPVGGRQ